MSAEGTLRLITCTTTCVHMCAHTVRVNEGKDLIRSGKGTEALLSGSKQKKKLCSESDINQVPCEDHSSFIQSSE